MISGQNNWMTKTKWTLTLNGFEIDEAIQNVDRWQIRLHVTSKTALCPCCGQSSRYIHSYYERTLVDLPVNTQTVQLKIQARRFECHNEQCKRKIFCERLSHFAGAHDQRSTRLTTMIRAIGLALNAEGGKRLAKQLGIQVSRDSVLRIIRRTPLEVIEAPKVIGIDDWAIRKRQRYGTLIVDHERRRPIDLFEGRSAADLAIWLRQHPDIKIATRDRSGEYAQALKQILPDTQQVADRWHLLQNLKEAVQQTIQRHQRDIEQTWQATAPADGSSLSPFVRSHQFAMGQELSSHISREGRKARFEQVQQLRDRGASISQIARHLDMHRNTVRIYYYADTFPERRKNRSNANPLDPHVLYLQQRFEEGCQNAMQLWREIRAQGFTGSYKPVARWLWLRRETPALKTPLHRRQQDAQHRQMAIQRLVDVPSMKQLAWLIVAKPKSLSPLDQTTLNRILKNKTLNDIHCLVQRFGQMVRKGKPRWLDSWLTDCEASSFSRLQSFARGIRADYAAVKAALSTHLSNGPTEGHVNRLKLIKRLMFGRAKFDLLRIKVLASP